MVFPVIKELKKISQKRPGEVITFIQGQVIKLTVLLAHIHLTSYNLPWKERKRREMEM